MLKIAKKHLFFLPTVITLCSLLCGLWSIFTTIFIGNIEFAICLIVVAGLLDAVDGRVARFFGVSGTFGVELDSLCDFLSFGIAPIFVYFHSYNWHNDLFAFAILTTFCACMALRLARFNMLALSPSKNNQKLENLRKNFFFGLAAPVGAFVLLLPVVASILNYGGFSCSNCALLYAFVVALFLVIPIPIFGHKSLHFGFGKKTSIIFSIIVAVSVVLFFLFPLKAIFFGILLYIWTIPFSMLTYNLTKKKILSKGAV